ncbi:MULTISPECIES: Sec-independent protein translocase protein TatB [unclassified Janthinobacterium]|uniref:Sec-independent protein translocase protein TatB n=1 Tax=unclassified Janthinobacterium TaxID=2610881 RepID=UPI000C1675F2|nr:MULTISPECIES: Sec-independent protein translocase protein TatB [unclassified Janthinobacterium]MDN2680619.1 Sec-independent protein translocase protein TatB [Janthinobacterium sp. SUN033]MDO8069748.1 Sec-independent protein translocase protein TatB [Janthinobacterium sp. SUN206]MDO8074704.1 Sec-independent protein translocase protein TatB [Janthinobacterium sp. SUN176]PIF10830.1 sec-independent protein translocase protein TatB [Janthinobacterium sp. 13]
MIDLGLSKIAIIGVVALIVIGPEKLPRVARMAGTLYGRAQRYLNQVKSEVSREIEMEELKNLQKEVQDAAHSVKQSVEKSMHGVENSISGNLAEVESAWRGDASAYEGQHDAHEAMLRATNDDLARKAREFRRKKLVRNSAIPGWYKQRHGGKLHVQSAAARVARFRPRASSSSFYS